MGRCLMEAFSQAGFTVLGMTMAECEQPEDRILKSLTTSENLQLIVHAYEYAELVQVERYADLSHQLNVRFTQLIAEHAARQQCLLIMLSSYLVFPGSKKNPYIAANEPAPLSRYGLDRAEAESIVRSTVEKHIILRTGLLLHAGDNSQLMKWIRSALAGDALLASPAHQINPTAVPHLAQVVVAVSKQLFCDPLEVWGTYHYADGEPVSVFDFLGAVLQSLSGYVPGFKPALEAYTEGDPYNPGVAFPLNGVLGCIKIRNTFGIKQKAWRLALPRLISEILEQIAQNQSAESRQDSENPGVITHASG